MYFGTAQKISQLDSQNKFQTLFTRHIGSRTEGVIHQHREEQVRVELARSQACVHAARVAAKC